MTRQSALAPRLSSPTTIKDVAQAAGVSTATVSRSLSGQPGVSEGVRKKVLEVARFLDYEPNRIARSLRVGQAQAVGVMIPDIENPFFTTTLRGIESVLLEAGYALLLANLAEDAEREQIHLKALLAEAVAGIIFTPTIAQTADYASLKDTRLALVAMSREPRELPVDFVTVDNERGAYQAVSRLLRLGHTRIAFIAGPPEVSSTRERLRGYRLAFAEAGRRPPRGLLIYSDFRQPSGYSAMSRLLDLSRPPTALFSGSSMATMGALQAIHERGLSVPEDIAIIGFDDVMPWPLAFQPALTVVAQPAFEIGATAARLMLGRIEDPERPPRRVVLQTELIVRKSCAAPGKTNGKE